MVQTAIILLALHIAIRDVRTHMISNHSNLALMCLLFVDSHRVSIHEFLVAWILLLLISVFTHLGGGDFKLLTVLLITQGKILVSINYGLGLAAALTVALIASLLIRRNLKGSIPMGPSILAPFIFGYLAI